jgi:hypothetical protein
MHLTNTKENEMHKFKKQSMIDWSCEIDGNHFAWITKIARNQYQVQFKGYEPVDGFETLSQAKSYVKFFNYA